MFENSQKPPMWILLHADGLVRDFKFPRKARGKVICMRGPDDDEFAALLIFRLALIQTHCLPFSTE